MPDIRERIRNSRPDPETLEVPDLDALVHRAQRRRVAARTVSAVAAVLVVAAGVVAVQAVRPNTTVYLDDGAGGSAQPSDEGASEPRSSSADTASLDEAIDQLIAANRQAPPRPVPGDPGEVSIQRTYAIWSSTSVHGDGTTATSLEVVWYEHRTDHLGNTEIVREALGEVQPTDDIAALRDEAAQFIDRGPPEGAQTLPGSSSAMHAEQVLQEAELDARGSAEPAPDSTERPDQAHAFMQAADALRTGLQPQDRIRALEVIGALDASLVEYRGPVKDLLGREGMAIAGRDGDWWGAPRWDVLIFDPATGDLLGEYSQFADGAQVDAPPITGYTALEWELIDEDE